MKHYRFTNTGTNMTDQELDYIIAHGTNDEVAEAILIKAERMTPEERAASKKAQIKLMKILDNWDQTKFDYRN
tara:strand:- start:5932 stop:6150 length:219 start_codon:yes stop_codon:yes gene_type:complete